MKITFILPGLFLLIIGIFRYLELKWLYKDNRPGKVYAGWTLKMLTLFYGMTVIGSIIEYYVQNTQLNLIISLVALVLMVSRLITKRWLVRTLKANWSPHIEIKEKHKLITSGIYNYIRHPIYLGAIIDIISVPLLLNSYYSLFCISTLYIILIIVRIHIEEKVLVETFGVEYLRYKKITGSIFPKILK
jgi:protein-S-isoprenylcysteine O-methyltransferase Ste14